MNSQNSTRQTKISYHPPKALEKLILHFKGKAGTQGKALRMISKKLDFQWGSSHIYNVYKGRSPATPKFKDKINQLAYKTFNPERFWLSIHALTKEQKDRWKSFSMEDRRKALDNMGLPNIVLSYRANVVIEYIVSQWNDWADKNTMAQEIYKFSHVSVGDCKGHEDWIKELEDLYFKITIPVDSPE